MAIAKSKRKRSDAVKSALFTLLKVFVTLAIEFLEWLSERQFFEWIIERPIFDYVFERPRARQTEILHKSDNFILLNKPYDVKINSNNPNEKTIQTELKSRFPSMASKKLYHEYYFMHRLDYSTSGIMCIPVHKRACQVASKAIESRNCKKYYLAIVRGHLSSDILDLDFPIAHDMTVTAFDKMCVLDEKSDRHCRRPRQARSILAVLEKGTFENYPATKLLIRPITGRRHQIRVHCSYIGHTIVGDYTYSNKTDVVPYRMFLHSFRLVLPNGIEDIECQTADPFAHEHLSMWHPALRKWSIEEAFKILDGFVDTNL